MKRFFIFTILATLLLGACSENPMEQNPTQQKSELCLSDLTAGFTDKVTRTYVENDKYLRWHEADLITAFYGNTLNRQYKFKGVTGDNSGTFSLVPSGELGTGNDLEAIYALYPYDETASITDQGVISLSLPATQSYAENSFGKDANTMIAVTENIEDTFLGFKNACGYLKLKLYGENITLASIDVKGNNNEKIAGAATATITFGEVPQLTMADDATTTVTIDCGEGVTLGTTAETATEFWVVLPETTFEGGITITATDTEGRVFEELTSNIVVITRNDIQPMATLEVVAEEEQVVPETWKIYYTSTDGEIVEPKYTTVFGANIVSNTYENGQGVITFDGPVTKMGVDAFNGCSSLASVTIPEGITSIERSAFNSCLSLVSATIPEGVTSIGDSVFENCTSLESITIPESVTTIGNYVFDGCSSMTSVTIPSSVTWIGWSAFTCVSLTRVDISDLTAWCKIHFENGSANPLQYAHNLYLNGVLVENLVIPQGITSILQYAFLGCGSLVSVVIPDGVTELGEYIFKGCESLTSITIPEGVTSFGEGMFRDCTSLSSVTIPDSVTSIGSYAFQNCTSLTSVTIPDGVTELGDFVFYECRSLESLYFEPTTPPTGGVLMFDCNASGRKIYVPAESVEAYKSATYWDDYAYAIYPMEEEETGPASNEIWYTTTDGNIEEPNDTSVFGANIVSNTYNAERECWVISFDGDVTSIGRLAFFCCESLTSVTIPGSATSIEWAAFNGCSSLERVTFLDGVTEIGDSAFICCESLTSVTIPSSVTTIGDDAFIYCTGLKSITIPDSVTSIGQAAFYCCNLLESVFCKPTTPPTGAVEMFGANASERKIYVPEASVEAYKAAEYWSGYASAIVGY